VSEQTATRRELASAAQKQRAMTSLAHTLGRSGQKYDLSALSEKETDQLLDVYWKAVARNEAGDPVGVMDLGQLTDEEWGLWERLTRVARGAPRNRDRRKPASDSFERRLRNLATRALGGDRDPATSVATASWAEAAQAAGTVLASRTLWDEFRDGIVDQDDLTVLWYCLGAISEAGGGEAVVKQRALGRSRSFRDSLDHLTVNEWLDSKREGTGRWRIRLGPAAHAEQLRKLAQATAA
jgi:hypothetical protein